METPSFCYPVFTKSRPSSCINFLGKYRVTKTGCFELFVFNCTSQSNTVSNLFDIHLPENPILYFLTRYLGKHIKVPDLSCQWLLGGCGTNIGCKPQLRVNIKVVLFFSVQRSQVSLHKLQSQRSNCHRHSQI